MFCSNCGKNMEGTNFCSNCGQTSVSAAQSVIQEQNANQANNSSLPKDNLGLVGFICGIVGFLCCTYVALFIGEPIRRCIKFSSDSLTA